MRWWLLLFISITTTFNSSGMELAEPESRGQKRSHDEISSGTDQQAKDQKQQLTSEKCDLLWLKQKARATQEMTPESLAYGLAILPFDKQCEIIEYLKLHDQIDPYFIGRIINADSCFIKEPLFMHCPNTLHSFTEYISIDYYQAKAINRFLKCTHCCTILAESVNRDSLPSMFQKALFFLHRNLKPREFLYYEVCSGDLIYCGSNEYDWFRLRVGAPLSHKKKLLKGKLNLRELLLLLLHQQLESDESTMQCSLTPFIAYTANDTGVQKAQQLRKNREELCKENREFERLKSKIVQLTKKVM